MQLSHLVVFTSAFHVHSKDYYFLYYLYSFCSISYTKKVTTRPESLVVFLNMLL